MINNKMVNMDNKYPPIDYLKVPRRGPIDIMDGIRYFLINNKVCEIGCASGFLLNYVINNYNKNAFGIEYRKNAVVYCKNNKLPVEHCDAINEKIPNADVYYGWFGNYDIEKSIIKNINNQYDNKIIILFFSKNNGEVLDCKKHIQNLNFKKYELKDIIPEKEPHNHYRDGFEALIMYF